jgi:multidrug efflux system membrane fusion protein
MGQGSHAATPQGAHQEFGSTLFSAKTTRWVFAGSAGVALLIGVGVFGPALFGAQTASRASTAPDAALPVSVRQIEPETVKPFAEFSGRIHAVDYAEIRPQVSGRITEVRFSDGQRVAQGDVLFVIDPRPYQAAVDKAQADLATATNNAKFAKIENERGSQLVRTSALSQETADQRNNADAVAQASVQSAQAALNAAQVNLDYAFVKAPISGRISRAEITVGNLVGSPTTAPPLLASIVSDNGVYADFDVDEQTYLNSVRSYGHTPEEEQRIPVELIIRGDTGHQYSGRIESFDNRIDTGTGTIRARAQFDNADGSLIPGMFASVRMGNGALNDALVVPESAIGNDQSKRFVFVVGNGDKAEYRSIQLGPQVDGRRVVLAGLTPGDRVILDHLQRLAPGVPVAPQAERTASR